MTVAPSGSGIVEPPSTPARRIIRRRRIALNTARYAALVLMAVVCLGPLLWQISTSLKGHGVDIYSSPPQLLPEKASLDAYSKVSDIVPIWRYAMNSLIIAVSVVITNIIGATCAGYALAKMDFRGKKLALTVFLTAMLVPGEVVLIAKYMLTLSMGINNSLLGVILPSAVGALNVLLMRNAMAGIPDELEEAGTLDGANAWQRFRHIAVPSVRGTTAVVAIFAFVGSWDGFLWPLIVLSDQSKYTLTVGLNYLQGTFQGDPRVIAAGTVVAILPLVIFFFALQRYFFRGVGEGAVKG
ncbi:carbohydrate ABC transporter permease [Streptomyces sp. NPDC019224]|uniref:carbohydrate ABC transporter permease n=1 Tax=Streptomyces sp. NPDC019224 TaxID=3154484 RepID=UPI0033E25C8B